MERLRNRKGAIAVVVAILMTAFLMIAAAAVDISRLYAIRTDFLTMTDAASLAGAVELLKTGDADAAELRAEEYAEANQLNSQRADIVAERGAWVRIGEIWQFQTDAGYVDAIRVRATYTPPSFLLIGKLFGGSPPELARTSIAWAGATVSDAQCFKPWAVPYEFLIQRVNEARGLPIGEDRDLTPQDIAIMRDPVAMGEPQRRLELYQDHEATSTLNSTTVDFGAIALPAAWRASTQAPGSFDDSETTYRTNIGDAGCGENNRIAVGDWIIEAGGSVENKARATFEEGPALIGQTVKIAFWDDALPPPGLPAQCGASVCRRVRTIGWMLVEDVTEACPPSYGRSNCTRMQGLVVVAPGSGVVTDISTPILSERPLLVR